MSKRRRPTLVLWLTTRPVEFLFFHLVVYGLRLLPIDWASAVGGALAKAVGPRLRFNGRALAGLRIAFPNLSDARRQEIAIGMWENLGRVGAEYAHLGRITAADSDRVELVGLEHIQSLGRDGSAAILASGHLANWEILPVIAAQMGLKLTGVVREPNNPLVRPLLRRIRSVAGGTLINKGTEGAKQAIAALRQGGVLAMLIDQKMSDGIAIEFFGHEAMTAAAPAQLALRFTCPLVPVRVERLDGARFRVTCYPPLEVPDSGDRNADTAALMAQFYGKLEEWIRDRPEQWLWLHRRWPKAVYHQSEAAYASRES